MVLFRVVLYQPMILLQLAALITHAYAQGDTCRACNCQVKILQVLEELIDQKIRDSLAGKLGNINCYIL